MLNELISMAWTGYYGGYIGDLLYQWEQAGIFSYVLPFLLIFAIVFGVLTRLNLFKGKKDDGTTNRTINAIVALVVGLLALQFELVPIFFSEIFPRIGVALSIILAILVLAGLFIDPDNRLFMNGLMAVVLVIVAVVIYQSFGGFGFSTGYWVQAYWGQIITVGLLIALLVAVVASAKPKKNEPSVGSILAETLRK